MKRIEIYDSRTDAGFAAFLEMLLVWYVEKGSLTQALDNDAASLIRERTEAYFASKKEDTISFVAGIKEDGNKFHQAGFIWIQKLDQQRKLHGFINEFWVAPQFRGSVIGRRLFEQALAWMKKNHIPRVHLNVSHYNHRARAFYESAGFVRQRAVHYHYYQEQKPFIDPIEGGQIQLRRSAEYDSDLWAFSKEKYLREYEPFCVSSESLVRGFESHKNNSDFDDERTIVFLALDTDHHLVGYVWGKQDPGVSDDHPAFTVQEFFVVKNWPDRHGLCKSLLQTIFAAAFERGIQDLRAISLDPFGADLLVEMNFTPSNYEMILQMNEDEDS